MIRAKFFLNNIVYPDIFNKFMRSFFLESIKIKIYLKDVHESDSKLLFDSFYLLEILSNVRPFCTKKVKRIDKRHSISSFECTAELREDSMYSFLDYYHICRHEFLIQNRNRMSKECIFKLRNFLLVVEDVRFWLNIPEELLLFDLPINIEFFFNDINFTNPCLYILNSLKFPTQDKRAFFRSKDDLLSEKRNSQVVVSKNTAPVRAVVGDVTRIEDL
jgi:hypothetical protein